MTAVLHIILPFKIFMLISWFPNTDAFTRFINSIYRTLFSVLRVIILAVFSICAWTCGFYIVLRDRSEFFESFLISLVNFIMFPI